MIVGPPATIDEKKIYDTSLEICWNNHFSHDVIFDHLGGNGFDLIMAVLHERLTKGVNVKYTSKDGIDVKALSKAERYLQPIVMMKKEKKPERLEEYECVNTTFQSTSSCNIQMANIMNQCS